MSSHTVLKEHEIIDRIVSLEIMCEVHSGVGTEARHRWVFAAEVAL